MKVKLDNLNPGTWFNFNDAKPEDGGICLRVANTAILQEIGKVCSTKHFDYAKATNDQKGKAQRFEWVDFDEEKAFEMRWDYCIVDWKNLTDSNDVQIECTLENKKKLMGEQIVFSAFVLSCLKKLNKTIMEELEEQAKNLFGTSKDISGDSTAVTVEQSTQNEKKPR